MGCNLMWVTRSFGWYVTASLKKFCWPVLCASLTQGDLTALLKEVKERLKELTVPVKGVISDGEDTLESAIAFVFPQVPHQLCQFHYRHRMLLTPFTKPTGMLRQS